MHFELCIEPCTFGQFLKIKFNGDEYLWIFPSHLKLDY